MYCVLSREILTNFKLAVILFGLRQSSPVQKNSFVTELAFGFASHTVSQF